MERAGFLIATIIIKVIGTGDRSIESRHPKDLTWNSTNSDATSHQDENQVRKTDWKVASKINGAWKYTGLPQIGLKTPWEVAPQFSSILTSIEIFQLKVFINADCIGVIINESTAASVSVKAACSISCSFPIATNTVELAKLLKLAIASLNEGTAFILSPRCFLPVLIVDPIPSCCFEESQTDVAYVQAFLSRRNHKFVSKHLSFPVRRYGCAILIFQQGSIWEWTVKMIPYLLLDWRRI